MTWCCWILSMNVQFSFPSRRIPPFPFSFSSSFQCLCRMKTGGKKEGRGGEEMSIAFKFGLRKPRIAEQKSSLEIYASWRILSCLLLARSCYSSLPPLFSHLLGRLVAISRTDKEKEGKMTASLFLTTDVPETNKSF